jgi:hypothetical protein
MSELGSLFAAGTLLSLGGLGLYLYQSNDDDNENDDDNKKDNIEMKVDEEDEKTKDEEDAPTRSSIESILWITSGKAPSREKRTVRFFDSSMERRPHAVCLCDLDI